MDILILGLVAMVGLYMAWNIGANDVANSMADAVGSRAVTIRQAVILAGICEFAGAVLVGNHVTDTVRQGIVDPGTLAAMPGLREGEAAALMVLGMGAALLAAAIWLHIATLTGMPVSTTHSIVGAIAGFGIMAAGWGSVNWGKMGQIVASWFISPVAGGLIAFLFFNYISKAILGSEQPVAAARRHTPYIVFFLTGVVTLATIYKGLTHLIRGYEWLTDTHTLVFALFISLLAAVVFRKYLDYRLRGRESYPLPAQLEAVESVYVPLVIISSCSVAFAHGANDVANAVGPLAAVAEAVRSGEVGARASIPPWVLVIGAIGIALGLMLYGPRLIRKIGSEITELDQMRAFCIAMSAAVTVIVASQLGLPVSSTHIAVGGVFGVGFLREYLKRRQAGVLETIRLHHLGADQAVVDQFLAAFDAASIEGKRELLRQLKSRPPGAQALPILSPPERKRLKKVYRQQLVKRSELLKIAAAWVVTVPATSVLAAMLYFMIFGMVNA
jgi:inorganic phosphate transporter, PiT family